MNITIIGTGYVGLVTAACFSELGHNVTCLDINKIKINNLKKGIIPFFEPNLIELVTKNIRNKKLIFTTSYSVASANNVLFICVDTPNDKFGQPNLSSINSVAQSLAVTLKKDSIIVMKSTVPLGTSEIIKTVLKKTLDSQISIEICSNPEFLREGSAIQDFMRPDRIIIGTESDEVKDIMRNIYARLNRQTDKLIFMSSASAELTKYASNAFLATKISFVNEIAQIAEKIDANMHQVRIGMGSDPRIGNQFLYAGLGYGGSCFPKDVVALQDTQKKLNLSSGILAATSKVNANQLNFFMKKIDRRFKKDLGSKTIAIWGLSFKPDTDDIRESISIKLIKALSTKVKFLNLYDPVATKNAKIELSALKNIKFFTHKDTCLKGANALVVCTEWKEFWSPNPDSLSALKDRVVFDGRNFLDPDSIAAAQVDYIGIGI